MSNYRNGPIKPVRSYSTASVTYSKLYGYQINSYGETPFDAQDYGQKMDFVKDQFGWSNISFSNRSLLKGFIDTPLCKLIFE